MQYSEIYRRRVIEYRQAGHTLKETHEIFQVSIGAIQKWEKRLAVLKGLRRLGFTRKKRQSITKNKSPKR